ncbi:MAG: phosphotransferase, partial [Wenzhouxiangellaceae bacterium]
MNANDVDDDRAREAVAWAAGQLGWTRPEAGPASSDASFRRYFRIRSGDASFVVMDAPPQRERLEPFIDVAGRLARAGLNVPGIIAADHQNGFLLLDDLGCRPYHKVLD